MDTNTFFSKLKTQLIPVNCLRKGDIVRIGDSIIVLESVTHRVKDGKETMILNSGACSWYYDAYRNGPDNKWDDLLALIRECLADPKPVRRQRRR